MATLRHYLGVAKGQIPIWPFLLSGAATALLAVFAWQLSAGLPWGVDDGVKRLFAVQGVASSGASLLLSPPDTTYPRPLFALPEPYAVEGQEGYRGIFPVLYPLLGAAFFACWGTVGFHLLSALIFSLLLWRFVRFVTRTRGGRGALWAALLLSSSLLFYALTFWEHPLGLLLLIPLFRVLTPDDKPHPRWIFIGLAVGLAFYLRPEITLLFLPMIFLPPRLYQNKPRSILFFLLGIIMAFALTCGIEKIWQDRWLAPQIAVNGELILTKFQGFEILRGLLPTLFGAPISWPVFLLGCILLGFLAKLFRNPNILAAGLPGLSLLSLLYGLLIRDAYTLTCDSQGLLFAWPWVAASCLHPVQAIRERDPLVILGAGFFLLALLGGLHEPGMHWGPRFFFPALIPLLLLALKNIRQLPFTVARLVVVSSGLFALLYGAASVGALAQRGSASREVAIAIRSDSAALVVLERWHEGADLQPLWGGKRFLWVQGAGDAEELLVNLQQQNLNPDFCWLHQRTGLDLWAWPVEVRRRRSLPDRAGWSGQLLTLKLSSAEDKRWGEVYWHTARRRAEEGDLEEALQCLQQALPYAPENADLHYDMAVCWGKLGKVDSAVAELKAALRLNPQQAAAQVLYKQLGAP